MPLTVKCSCNRVMRLDDALAGKHIRCPGCQGVLLVPSNPATVKPATSSPTPAERQRPQATPKPAAESKTRVQSSPPPERKRRQTAVPSEPSSYDVYDVYDVYDGATLPPRPTGTRAKASKSSSFNVMPIIAVLGVVLLLGGAGFGVWKLVQLIPEDFGKSKSLLPHPRGQYGPFTLDFPASARMRVVPDSLGKSEYPLEVDGVEYGRQLTEIWNVGDYVNIEYKELDLKASVSSMRERNSLVPQLIVVRTPERKSAVALVFLPSFPSMCLVVGSTPFRRGDRCNSMRTV